MKIAVIGAGISGLVLARELAALGEVTVFEKARGVGGRMSTRYADPFYFDHGAQFFTARTEAFQDFLAPYLRAGVVQEWEGKVVTFEEGKRTSKRLWFEPHFVGSPNMNNLCKALAEGVRVATQVEVAPLGVREGGQWQLADKDGKALGAFDCVISTAPPAQTQRLYGTYLPVDAPLQQSTLTGCYAVMVGFAKPWQENWIAARVQESPLQWISVNSSKPGRNAGVTCLVAHSRNDWAEAHIDADVPQMQELLVRELETLTGIDCTGADYLFTHRWRYAVVENALKPGPFADAELKLGAASDWCGTSRIEECWEAAVALAERVR
ncbi:MAG: FAD-dependent oxidoreductase [Rickettsiales bacterium]|nr:FAD-dependent oxidoreductase [Rickettsiales bacterium]